MGRTRREFFKTTAVVGAMFRAVAVSLFGGSAVGRTTPFPTQRSKALLEIFGLKYPIFEASHGSATCPELAIAVSNAGAMGALAIFGSPEEAHDAVSKVRSGTKGPFLVNFLLQFEPVALRSALDAGAPIVQFSWGMPTKEMLYGRG